MEPNNPSHENNTSLPQEEVQIRKPHLGLILLLGIIIGAVLVILGYLGYTNYERFIPQQVQEDTPIIIEEEIAVEEIRVPTKVEQVLINGEDSIGAYVQKTFYVKARKGDTPYFSDDGLHDFVTNTYYTTLQSENDIRIVWKDGPKEFLGHRHFEFTNNEDFWVLVSKHGNSPSLPIYNVGTLASNGIFDDLDVYVFVEVIPGMGVSYDYHYIIFPEGIENEPIELLNGTDIITDTSQKRMVEAFGYSIEKFITNVTNTLKIPKEFNIDDTDKLRIRTYGATSTYGSFNYTDNRFGVMNLEDTRYAEIPEGAEPITISDRQFFLYEHIYYTRFEDGRLGLYERISTNFSNGIPDGADKNVYASGYMMQDVSFTKQLDDSTRINFSGKDISAGGCGFTIPIGTNVLSDEPWFNELDLTPIGFDKKNSSRSLLYEVKETVRASHPYYIDFFVSAAAVGRISHEATQEEMLEHDYYREYLSGTPLIFWESSIGDWHAFYNIQFSPAVECGKPVIYLYPEETTDVRVQVAPNGGFTFVEPEYPSDGWLVRAEPNGELFNYADTTKYSYLFWEGHADGFGYSEDGWIFARETISEDLTTLLLDVGLNQTETADFVEFWAPKMVDAPYTFVTFASQAAFERAAPLTVTPTPDSVFRVFMYFEPREAYTKTTPLSYTPFNRQGFSVVEWGGVLADDKKFTSE